MLQLTRLGLTAQGLMNFDHSPYDTLPFFQERSFSNLWSLGALFRRGLGLPMPSSKFFSDGIAIEAMGARHNTAETQIAVEKKVRINAAILKKAPFGYRPAIGYQAARLVAPVDGPSYGSSMNAYPEKTVVFPGKEARFEKQYERRSQGYSKLHSIDSPEEAVAFDGSEITTSKADVKMYRVDA